MGCCYSLFDNKEINLRIKIDYYPNLPKLIIDGKNKIISHKKENNIYYLDYYEDNTKYIIQIIIDDAYSGVMPVGPPYDNIYDENDTIQTSEESEFIVKNLLHRSPKHKTNNTPHTILEILQSNNYSNVV